LKELKKKAIHTCLDTTGYVKKKHLTEAAKYTDLFLYDIKHFNEEKHTQYTEIGNRLILENLIMLDKLGKAIEIRYPLIPGLNDDESDLLKMAAFLNRLNHKPGISILPYHKIGRNKYRRFNIDFKMSEIDEPSANEMADIQKLFSSAGFETSIGG
jgi:pyruvate formate lyase activating enzyme